MVTDKKIDRNSNVARDPLIVQIPSEASLVAVPIALFRPGYDFVVTRVEGFCRDITNSVVASPFIVPSTGALCTAVLAVTAPAEKFKTTNVLYYLLGGALKVKAATDLLVFSAGHQINADGVAGQYWGSILVQIDAAGDVTTKVSAAKQLYLDKASAIAGLPAADAAKAVVGYISVQTKAATAWTANTDDMTAASDCAAVEFISSTPKKQVLNAAGGGITYADITYEDAVLNTETTYQQGGASDFLAVMLTTNGGAAAKDATMRLHVRPDHMNGEV